MEEIKSIFSDKEILSITNFVATDSTISALIEYIINKGYNPAERSYFNNLLPRLKNLNPHQIKELESYSREVNSTNFKDKK